MARKLQSTPRNPPEGGELWGNEKMRTATLTLRIAAFAITLLTASGAAAQTFFGRVDAPRENACGGIQGIECREGFFCRLDDPSVADSTGRCTEFDTIDDVPVATVSWQRMGSSGSIDETSLGRYAFRDGDVYLRDGRTGSVIARYDMGCPLELQGPPERLEFRPGFEARYKDDGRDSRVILSIRRTSFATGQTDTVLQFDSNDEPSSQGYRTFSREAPIFECERYGYTVEARLARQAGGDPRLQMVRIVILALDE